MPDFNQLISKKNLFSFMHVFLQVIDRLFPVMLDYFWLCIDASHLLKNLCPECENHKKRPAYTAGLLCAWQRPTLTGGNPQLPSALRSLTSVFGMGTGVTFSPSPPDSF